MMLLRSLEILVDHYSRGAVGSNSAYSITFLNLKIEVTLLIKMNGKTIECHFCKYEANGKKLDYENKYFYVVVPKEPAMYGHILIVSKKMSDKHAEDITDIDNLKEDQLKAMIVAAQKLSWLMKKELKKDNGKRVRKVYVITQCETPHFHFHLKPRYENEYEGEYAVPGDAFLCLKELEEARWHKNESNNISANVKGLERIQKIELGLCKHKMLINSKIWARPDEERKAFIDEIKKHMDGLIKNSQFSHLR